MAKLFGKLFAKKEEEQEAKKSTFGKGLIIGIVIAVIILVVALVVIFGGQMFGKKAVKNPAGQTTINAQLKYTIVTSKSCGDKCWDTNLFFDVLKQGGVKEKGRTTVYIEDAAGKKLAEQFKITQVPTILVTGDLDKDAQLKSFFTSLGETIDKTFVLRQVIPPFVDIASGQLKGEVAITYITDTACKDCYDVKLHETSLTNFGVSLKNTKTVDISSDEGRALLKQYDITKVPTIIISGQPEQYQSLKSVWATVGTVASDGTYIFTSLDVMGGPYFDLAKDKLVKPAPATTTPAAK